MKNTDQSRRELLEENITDYLYKSENGGSFDRTIIKAIEIADMENLYRLYKAFPDLVDGCLGYTKGKTWEEFNS